MALCVSVAQLARLFGDGDGDGDPRVLRAGALSRARCETNSRRFSGICAMAPLLARDYGDSNLRLERYARGREAFDEKKTRRAYVKRRDARLI